ncbi:MAG: phosphoglycerate kinase [bacterium]|nr:phosphoglycerate kinase [bacterium]
MSRLRTLDDLGPIAGRVALVRVDFNVPLADGLVADDTRIRAALPTLTELRERGARLVLMSHCGRPKGERDPALSLEPVARHLAGILDTPVSFAHEPTGADAAETVGALPDGGVAMLENLRFSAGEKSNDPAFAAALAALGDIYVNDAFGTAHRAHASVVGVAEHFEQRAAGRLLELEIRALSGLLESPRRPFVGIVGGAKIEGKIETLVNLLPALDALAVGGGMANTFLTAQGFNLARSLVEHERLDLAHDLIEQAEASGTDLLLPPDLVVTDDLETPRRIETVVPNEVPEKTLAVDIGPDARTAIGDLVATAGTVFWNGPLGVFETPPVDAGTLAAAYALGACPGWTVIGGGETVAAAHRAGVIGELGHVSTGGGASLELLAGKQLPGVAVLKD